MGTEDKSSLKNFASFAKITNLTVNPVKNYIHYAHINPTFRKNCLYQSAQGVTAPLTLSLAILLYLLANVL